MQFRRSVNVIKSCKDCPCRTNVWQGDQLTRMSCVHGTVGKIYKRILEYYPNTKFPYEVDSEIKYDTPFGEQTGPAIAFSDSDIKEIEENGFPYWCPLERSK